MFLNLEEFRDLSFPKTWNAQLEFVFLWAVGWGREPAQFPARSLITTL